MEDGYHVMSVVLTNNGIYIFNDEEQSNAQGSEHHASLRPPDQVLSFNFKSVRRMGFAKRVEQRIVLKV